MGFKRVASYYDTTQHEVPTPTPTSEGFKAVLDAINSAEDSDSFLGDLASILHGQGFEGESLKVLRYPSIFCPCVTHETRYLPRL